MMQTFPRSFKQVLVVFQPRAGALLDFRFRSRVGVALLLVNLLRRISFAFP